MSNVESWARYAGVSVEELKAQLRESLDLMAMQPGVLRRAAEVARAEQAAGGAGRGGEFEEAAVLGWTSAMLDQYFDEICEAYCEIALEHRALQELNEFRTTLIAHLMTLAGLDSIDVSLDQANGLAGVQLRSNFLDAAGELTSSLPDRTGFRLTVVRPTSSRRH